MTINERIKALANSLDLNQSKLAQLVGTTRQTVSSIYGNKHAPKADLVASICQAFPELNAHWLLTGEGEMWKEGVEITRIGDIVMKGGKKNRQHVQTGGVVNEEQAEYGPENKPALLEAQVKHLQEIVSAKDKVIEEKERLIQILLNQKE